MSSQENNIIFQKTSFLSGTNSSYIEKLYAKYVENPASIPDSWRQFFEGLGTLFPYTTLFRDRKSVV